MVGKCIVHRVSHTRTEFQLRVHLRPALRRYCVIDLGTELLTKVLSIVAFQCLPWIYRVFFAQLKPSSASIVNAMVSVL